MQRGGQALYGYLPVALRFAIAYFLFSKTKTRFSSISRQSVF